jgi:hypothetical protein
MDTSRHRHAVQTSTPHTLSPAPTNPRPILDAQGNPRAEWTTVNILTDPLPKATTKTLIAWSGWLGESSPSGGTERRWERDHRTWSPSAYDQLAARLRSIREHAEHTGTKLLLRPHARHILNDPQRCARYLTDFAGPTFGLALDPVSMLEPSMLPSAEEHLVRIMERLGSHTHWLVLPEGGIRVVGQGEDARLAFLPGTTPPGEADLSHADIHRILTPSMSQANIWLDPGTP